MHILILSSINTSCLPLMYMNAVKFVICCLHPSIMHFFQQAARLLCVAMSAQYIQHLAGFNSSLSLDSIIGSGAFSKIYKIASEPLVVKLTLCSNNELSIEQSRLRRDALMEVEILSTMTAHPHIVAFKAHVIENDRILVLLQHVEGKTLSQLYEKNIVKTWSCDNRKVVLRALISALVHLHDHGFIHRDISNNNVMIDYEGKVVLIDFCFATQCIVANRNVDAQAGKTSSRRCQGTLGYCAPETSNRSDWVTESADAFAVVCVTFDLLAGEIHEQSCGYHDLLEDEPSTFPIDEVAFDKVAYYTCFISTCMYLCY